ncbi:3-dehydroquinate synthase [Spirochaeta cellobiosiphila]|uniref:3-dehydroquinate synthase n=1 Tax=Spirochaeta cellobiosiphila TaxID=504483 RepID=UPI0004041ED4|nr:3-dehydroquinate synthase family protein [Spirochaeta cellobiosiphila]
MSSLTFEFNNFKTDINITRRELIDFTLPKLIIADTNTSSLISGGVDLVLPPGEPAKHWQSVDQILEIALNKGLTRDSIIMGVGGGVITDMTAFAASLYMRGCGLTLVPTTLLAMVDAAFGGKTGIDYHTYKNLVGTFYPAQNLIICVDFLLSLPDHEFKNGLAEVIKTAMLGDGELLDLLENKREDILERDLDLLEQVVVRCLRVKGHYVTQDLKEGGIRAQLNLGHTFGHALESLSGLSALSHGEGVAWGMRQALQVGVSMGVTNPEYAGRINSLLDAYSFDTTTTYSKEELLAYMEKDKKKQAGKLRFILQKDLMDTQILTIEREKLLELWSL